MSSEQRIPSRVASSGGQSGSPYIPGIDGLRAIAVLSVLIYHLDHSLLPGGFTGVDVFFVISGYVISKSLATSYVPSFSTYITGFYKRRILRIVPALLFVLVITSIVSSLFIPEAWLSSPNEETALWAFFGISNFSLASGADGYFSIRIPFNPFVHTWSLAVEEQFYLIFPLIFYIWLTTRSSDTWTRIAGLLLLPIIALTSLIFSSHETAVAHHRAFYLLPSRFWELAAGALLFQVQAHGALRLTSSKARSWLEPAGLALLGVGFGFSDEAAFPFPWALVPVLGSLMMIAGMTAERSATSQGIRSLMESRSAVFVGRISYSLYLWHWPVFSVFRWTVGLTQPLTIALALLLTFSMSVLSYHFVENKVRRNQFLRRSANWKVVSGGLAVVMLSFFGTYLFFQYDDVLGVRLSVTNNSCDWHNLYNPNCGIDEEPVSTTKMPGKQILVIGDSHAGAYHTLATLAAASLGAAAKFFTTPGCPVARLIQASNDDQVCREFEASILRWVKQNAKAGDIVFLASLRVPRLGDQWGPFDEKEVFSSISGSAAIGERKRAVAQAAEFVEKLKALGLYVLMDAPKPVFKAPAFRCSDWFNHSNPVCEHGFSVSRDMLLRLREPAMTALQNLSESHGIFLWDPFPILCDAPVCSAFKGSRPLFFDGDHLSGLGNRVLVPSFTRQLFDIWNKHAPLISPVVIGDRIDFSTSGAGSMYLSGGWSWPESWGVWSDGSDARLNFPLSTTEARSILIEASPLVSPAHPKQDIEIRVNGVFAAALTLTERSGAQLQVAIPDKAQEALAEQGRLDIEIRMPDAVRPMDIGVNDDPRRLALGLRAITID